MKLNVGCGKRYLDGYKNIDVQANPRNPHAPDIIADARAIPLPDGCADEILAIHLFEHFYRWQIPGLLKEWHRLLKPEGLLVLELPNLIKCCQNILAMYSGKPNPLGGKDPNQSGMWGLYGDPRYEDEWMCHRWAWSPESLSAVLAENGFGATSEQEPQWHPVGKKYRDMRIEARKIRA